jgi:AcrR family transcriptional regulator
MCTPVAFSRREENKQATRLALAQAALDVVSRDGMAALTADAIAERAGVSRRTFFNYFEDALLAPLDDVVDELVGRFLARPADEPLRQAMLAVLDEPLPTELLRQSAVLQREAARPDRSGIEARRFVLETTASKQAVLEQALCDRIGPDADVVYVAALSAAFLALMCRIDGLWVERTGGDVSPAGIAQHHELTRAALTHLISGFDESDAIR